MRDPQGWRQRNIRTVKQRNGERLPEWACLADTQIGRAGVHLGEHGEEKITPNKGGPAGFFQPVLSFTVQYRNRCLNGHKKVRQKYDRTLPWTYSLFTPAEQMVLENCRLAGAIDPLGPFTRRRSRVPRPAVSSKSSKWNRCRRRCAYGIYTVWIICVIPTL